MGPNSDCILVSQKHLTKLESHLIRNKKLWKIVKLCGKKNKETQTFLTQIGERSSIMSAGLGGGGLSQNADTAEALEEGWWGRGMIQNADVMTLWMEGVGELKTKASIVANYKH